MSLAMVLSLTPRLNDLLMTSPEMNAHTGSERLALLSQLTRQLQTDAAV